MRSKIVVTGMGIVSPLGCGVDQVWRRLIDGQSGIVPIDRFPVDDFPIRIAGLVPDHLQDESAGLDHAAIVSPKDQKKIDLFTLYALAAAEEALSQANWFPASEADQMATATIIATGIGGFPTITAAQKTLDTKGYKRLSPFTAPAFLANMAAGNLSIRYKFRGPLGCPITACAAGIQAIGDGMRMIHSGEAKVALVGGTEACIDPLALASFHALRALSTRNDDPEKASRPFDRERDGFVMGEGAGLLVIEELEHALERGATPLAILSGYGTSADACHITSGPEDGSGGAAAMRIALSKAGLAPEEIGYINAHATATPGGDKSEVAALRNVFSEHLAEIPVSSTKSATGHLLGAAGGVESIFSILAARDDKLPPTLNLDAPDQEFSDLNLVPNQSIQQEVQHALCNGLGFGGVNASLIVSKA
ncbi:MAG: beta-ketoacyl-[acyl-carrier-protein] synthase II [Gammaproteobacteria bacterium]|nr:MAG: beta-ketoacyl-[acyl-carrier-protein] synthase II [Gammaproteobacteria bacterium]